MTVLLFRNNHSELFKILHNINPVKEGRRKESHLGGPYLSLTHFLPKCCMDVNLKLYESLQLVKRSFLNKRKNLASLVPLKQTKFSKRIDALPKK